MIILNIYGQLTRRLIYAFNRAKVEGLLWTLKELVKRSILWSVWLFLVPIALLLHLVGFRRIPIFTHRIGHLAGEIDCFLKKKLLGEIPESGRYYFILAPSHLVANQCLLDYWKPHVSVLTNPLLCMILSLLTRGPIMRHNIKNYLLAIGHSAEYYSVQSRWADRPPLLRLNTEHYAVCNDFLDQVGIPRGAWFVCVHSRDGGYSKEDENVQSYRNTTVNYLLPAMQAIVARGGVVYKNGGLKYTPIT